jgi:hypothetical protein
MVIVAKTTPTTPFPVIGIFALGPIRDKITIGSATAIEPKTAQSRTNKTLHAAAKILFIINLVLLLNVIR